MNLSKIPLSQMSPTQFLDLGMDEIMRDIRQEANKYKLRGWRLPESMYMIGRLHGLWFYGARWALWNDGREYDRLSEKFEAYSNEAYFLYGEYQDVD